MIFLEKRNGELTGAQHFRPFHEEFGLGKTENELSSLGILVDSIPEAEQKEGFEAVLKHDVSTNELYYEYRNLPNSRNNMIDEVIRKNQSKIDYYNESKLLLMSLEEMSKAKIEALKEQCTNAIYEGFTSGENKFGYNANDQSNFTKRLATIAIGVPGPFQWKSINNGVVELSKEEFIQVVTDAETHQLEQQQKFWVLEQEVLEAETKEEVDLVNW